MRGDDSERQAVDSKHGRHGSGTFNGKATRLLMSHKVMFVVLGECVVFLWSVSDSTCKKCMNLSVCVNLFSCVSAFCVCTYAFDG